MNEVAEGIHVSDITTVREEPTRDFESIVTVCQESVADNVSAEQEYHFFCMADGPDNEYGGDSSYEIFAEAVDAVLDAAEPVLVHCHMGQSRSVSVVTAAIAVRDDIGWHEAFHQVRRYRPQADPDMLLVNHGQRYVEEYK